MLAEIVYTKCKHIKKKNKPVKILKADRDTRLITRTEEILSFYIYLGINIENCIYIFISFLTPKTFPGFWSFFSLREGSCRAGGVTLWAQLWLNPQLYLGAPGATAADVQTITKVNPQRVKVVSQGLKSHFVSKQGIIKSLYWMEKSTTLASVQSFPFLRASSVSHLGKQVRRLSPSEC